MPDIARTLNHFILIFSFFSDMSIGHIFFHWHNQFYKDDLLILSIVDNYIWSLGSFNYLWREHYCSVFIIQSSHRPFPKYYHPYLPRAHEVESGVKQLVHFCLSIGPSTNVSLWLRTNLISIECYIFNTNRNVNRKTNLFIRTLAVNSSTSRVRGEQWDNIFTLSACLAVKQNWKSFQTGNLLFLRTL